MGGPVDKDALDRRVEESVEELRLAGRLYQFTPEPRCKVCRSPDITRVVNKLLSIGETYANILRDIEYYNRDAEEDEKITYSSIRTHAKRHFSTDQAAQIVYRRILEKNAADNEIDYIDGVKNAVTPMAYLETVMVKGYESLVDKDTQVTPELGFSAAKQIKAWTDNSTDTEDIDEIVHKTNRIIEVVKSVVPVMYWDEIVRRLETDEDVVEGQVEAEEAEYEEEEDFLVDDGENDEEGF